MRVFKAGFALFSAVLLAHSVRAAGAPVIIAQPQSVSVPAGSTAAFTVGATGDPPLNYRWIFNRSLLPFETNTTLIISNASPEHVGSYLALVFNTNGFALSQPASLTLAQPVPPTIVEHPRSQTVAAGSSVTLAVRYSGTGPFRFQWRRNGINIVSATNDSLSLPEVKPSDAGDYDVVVHSALGAVLSDRAAIRVVSDELPFRDDFDLHFTIPVPSGSGRGSNILATMQSGEPAHVGKASGQSVWIAWQPWQNGIARISLSGSSFDTVLAVYTGDTLGSLFEVASDDDSGGYYASALTFNAIAGTHYKIAVAGLGLASGDFTFAWSLEVTDEKMPEILVQPRNQTVELHEACRFDVEATPADARFQWLFNGEEIAGATANSLIVASAGESDAGYYSVRVANGQRIVESRPASLQINLTPFAMRELVLEDKLAEAMTAAPLRLGRPPVEAASAALAAALPVSRGYAGTHLFSTFGAVSEPGEPLHCNVVGGASYWFSFVAEENGEARFDTRGSGFNTVLAVYTADGPGYEDLQSVACNDNSGPDRQDSTVTFQAEAGVRYLIVVDGVYGARGMVRLNYSLTAPAVLAALGRTAAGNRLRLSGQPEGTFEIQVSADCRTWTRLFVTNLLSGISDFQDGSSSNSTRRFYRALTLSP